MKKIIIRSLIISLVLSIIALLMSELFLTTAVSYDVPDFNMEDLYDMNFRDAMEYQDAHMKRLNKFEYILFSYKEPYFRAQKLKIFLVFFVSIFLGCVIAGYWQAKEGKT